MWSVPDGYADVVRSSNGLAVSVDVLKAGVVIYPGLPLVDGSITVTRSSCP
jgi:hypothetical protein